MANSTDNEYEDAMKHFKREEEIYRKAQNETVFLSQGQMNDLDVKAKFHSSRACAADHYDNSAEMSLYEAIGRGYEICQTCRKGLHVDLAALKDAHF